MEPEGLTSALKYDTCTHEIGDTYIHKQQGFERSNGISLHGHARDWAMCMPCRLQKKQERAWEQVMHAHAHIVTT